jgi:glycosyltransferase involved in cell wall biosynthesis
MMRIAYISNNDWPGTAAGLPFSVFTTKGLCDAGADAFLVLHGHTSQPVAVVRKALFDLDAAPPIVPLRAPRLGGSKFLFYLRAFLALRGSDRTTLITRNLNFMPWAMTLKKWHHMRVYYEAHNFWADPALRGEKLRAAQRRQVQLTRRWLAAVDGIICISEPLQRLYQQYYPALPVCTALPGVAVVQPVRRSAFRYTLGYIGSFDEGRYPLRLVMQALANIAAPEVRLLCIGVTDSATVARLREQATHLGLASRVIIQPWVSGRQLEQLKAQMDVGISVLADTFLTRLVCPTKIFDYLSTGTPFISSRFEGVAGLVQHGTHGLLVDNTPVAWEQAIRSMYADFTQYQHMATQCVALARTLGWQQRAQALLQFLHAAPAQPQT